MKHLLVILSVVLLVLIGCNRPEHYNKTYKIEYVISGTTTDASTLTYSNIGGDTEQIANVDLPYTITLNMQLIQSGNMFLYISAQNNQSYGDITTSIFINGKLIKTSTSQGGYVIATTSTLYYFED